jgi:hypothetical protein
MANTLTPTQQFKLKELNNKLYTGITGTNREELIENFDTFLQQYEKHVQFMEELNFFKNSIKERFYTKQMEIKVGKQPKNQADGVQQWLESGRTINWFQAVEYFGCARLSAVIFILRHDRGLNIKDVGSRRWADYKLIIEDDANA